MRCFIQTDQLTLSSSFWSLTTEYLNNIFILPVWLLIIWCGGSAFHWSPTFFLSCFLAFPSATEDVFALSYTPLFSMSQDYKLNSSFPPSFIPQTQVWTFAWLLDILSWMSAHSFKLITSDNNIVNSAQTVKHLTAIPCQEAVIRGPRCSHKTLLRIFCS